MPEVAKKPSETLYPDLVKVGGLPQALQPFLAKRPGRLVATGLDEPFIVYASVRTTSRSSQVMIAAGHRAFSVDFWVLGVQYARGWAASLDEVAAAIHAFLVDQVDVKTLKASHSWVCVLDQAFVHQQGPAEFVEAAWQADITRLTKEPPGSLTRELLPLIRACMDRPRLRALMPFTSLNRLCFSRKTGYPYTSECTPAFPLGDGRFRMQGAGAAAAAVDGDAESIAEALEASLAPDCPPAAHGTAEDPPG